MYMCTSAATGFRGKVTNFNYYKLSINMFTVTKISSTVVWQELWCTMVGKLGAL